MKLTQGHFLFGLSLLAVVIFAVHCRSLKIVHNEPDEMVYSYLALRLKESPMRYDLQGPLEGEAASAFLARILGPHLPDELPSSVELLYYPLDQSGVRSPRFDVSIYDRPIFHHPFAFPLALSLSEEFFGASNGVLVSAFFHVLAVIFTGFLGRRWGGNGVGLLGAFLLATEATSWVVAERLWIDSMLQCTVVASVLAASWAAAKGSLLCHILAGLVLGLACLTKLPACLIAPAIFLTWKSSSVESAPWARGAYWTCAVLPVFSWMVFCARVDGSFLRLSAPTPWMVENFPFIAQLLDRTPLYYVVALFLVSPVLVFALGCARRNLREPWMSIPLLWGGSFFLFMSAIGLNGMGFQLRYLAPMIPALCILAAATLLRCRRWVLVLGIALAFYSMHEGMVQGAVSGSVGPEYPQTLLRFLRVNFDWTPPTWLLSIW